MNRYHDAMEHCAPPPELEARLREAVLSAEPEPHLHPAVFRPRGFVRKTVLAAVIAAALTVSAGAVVVANWDAILASRFGAWAASTPMGQAAFQEVQITSVCDDVTLTVRQALVSEKTVYLVLDYQLPDTVDRDTVEMAYADTDWRTNSVSNPDVSYYLTGDISWEELKAADQDKWADIDWTDYTSYCDYMGRDASSLVDFRLINYTSGSSGHAESQGYDPETNTLTYLYSITAKDGSLDFTAQPLTLVVTPPVLRVDGVDTAVTDHPALLTFQPEAIGQTQTGSLRQDSLYAQATVSPFNISLRLNGNTTYLDMEELISDTSLVLTDGSTLPVRGLNRGGGYGGHTSRKQGEELPFSLSFRGSFRDLLDVSQVTAVQVGDVTIPLE